MSNKLNALKTANDESRNKDFLKKGQKDRQRERQKENQKDRQKEKPKEGQKERQKDNQKERQKDIQKERQKEIEKEIKKQSQKEGQREVQERPREVQERQREVQEQSREVQERQREVQDRQREVQERQKEVRKEGQRENPRQKEVQKESLRENQRVRQKIIQKEIYQESQKDIHRESLREIQKGCQKADKDKLPPLTVDPYEHPLQYAYALWYSRRNPGKMLNVQSYDQNLKLIGRFASVEQFWGLYSHLVRPYDVMANTDFHLFKVGIKPMWEDEANQHGGKWIVRLRKGLVSRCWENLILAMLGEQFMVGEEICGAVVSVRFQEDIICVWNKTASDVSTTTRIRDTLKRVLHLPVSTSMEYKTHNESLKNLLRL